MAPWVHIAKKSGQNTSAPDGGQARERHQDDRSPGIEPLQAVARANGVVVSEFSGQRQRHLNAQSPQQAGNGARQPPLGDRDAIGNKGSDHQDGKIAETDFGEIHHRKRKRPNELPDGPAPGNALTEAVDEWKLPLHVEPTTCRSRWRSVP